MDSPAPSGTPAEVRRAAPAVVIRNLRRSFDGHEAVRGVSLEIAEGEIFGLLGPNGAGKTTIISMVSTRIRPTSGEVCIYGRPVSRDVDAARRLLNVAPQEEALYPSLTAEENLRFFARLYGVPRRERRRCIAQALEMVGLTPRGRDRVATYSSGMRRRLNLGCALVSGPRLLLLDEPTVGVDPQSRAHIFAAVRSLRAQRVTIVYTTHYLQEAEALCDRIAIIDRGRIAALGTLPELLARSPANEVIELELARPPTDVAALERLDGVLRVEVAGTALRVFTARARGVLAALSATPSPLDEPIVATRVTPVTLENVFIEITGGSVRD